MSEGECFFKFSVFFLWKSKSLLKKLSKCEKICPTKNLNSCRFCIILNARCLATTPVYVLLGYSPNRRNEVQPLADKRECPLGLDGEFSFLMYAAYEVHATANISNVWLQNRLVSKYWKYCRNWVQTPNYSSFGQNMS